MSTSRKLPTKWPERPKDFYEDWSVFCIEALTRFLEENDDMFAVVLLAGGAVLGAGGMFALVQANREAIDAKGREWGIEKLGTLALGGGTLLGAAVGTLGVAWLNRTLGRHADRAKVDALQSRLAKSRREFEMLRQDRQRGVLDVQQHRLAVERLFLELLQREG